jgi:hypothetical protein
MLATAEHKIIFQVFVQRNHVDNSEARVISSVGILKNPAPSSLSKGAQQFSHARQTGCGPLQQAVCSGFVPVHERKHVTMRVGKFVLTEAALRRLLFGAAFLIVAGCATAPQTPSSPPRHPRRVVRPQPRPVDAKAQKRYYDDGLQYYSAEHYLKAKEAFEEVVDLGPHTALGIKAEENLRKIEKILKTLDELESK